ncbi:MAG: kinase [bacterium]|nr:kinase [bacterium]
MVITKTPFRISFFGGGTDYPLWYKENRGVVVNTTINKYCYISLRYLPPFFDCKYRIRYSKKEEVNTVEEIEHPKVRECLKFLNEEKGIEMVHTGDIPAMSGMGSSSSFTVGLLHALHALQGRMVSKHQLALDAIHIEQDRAAEDVGSQDQTAAAFGGLNYIEFKGDHVISVHPIIMRTDRLEGLERNLLLFFTGFQRTASEVVKEQIQNIPQKDKELKIMCDLADEAIGILGNENRSVDDFGRLLHETWRVKKSLSSKISNPAIDEIYDTGISAGALGGKLLGAGGGGFVLLYAKPESQEQVKQKLKNLLYVPFKFDNLGSHIIHHNANTDF